MGADTRERETPDIYLFISCRNRALVNGLAPSSGLTRAAVSPLPPKSSTCAKTEFSTSLYVGCDFSVRITDWKALQALVDDTARGGVVQCDFFPSSQAPHPLRLSVGGYRILTVPNAGGSSVFSEVLSFELLSRCFGAKLLQTEMEVSYFPQGGSITDYVCLLFGSKVTVSVTRAVKYKGTFCEEDALHLLNKKLKGVLQSSRNAVDKWKKQILHVWAESAAAAHIIVSTYHTFLSDEVKANTVVLITTAQHSDFIFSNG